MVAVDTSNNKSNPSNEANAAPSPPPPGGCGLQFNGSSQYVTFGPAGGLGVTSFTLESWVKRTGAGTTVSTGNGGVAAVPIIAKGRCENDKSNVDANYFLGIDTSNRLAADFEDMNTGLNHPITGIATVPADGSWHHVAVTYDQPTGVWRLYLDGAQDNIFTITGTDAVRSPRSDSIQHAALGTALDSAGSPTSSCATSGGFFVGVLDEARIWNYARTAQQIRSTINQELSPESGLIGRWSMNEGTGTTVSDSASSGVNGTVINAPAWVAGAPFNAPVDITAPAAPSDLKATPAVGQIELAWTANDESDPVAGYNIYRNTTGGVTIGTPLNGALLPTPAFTDSAVALGTTYHYAVTAVDASGNESALSGEASAAPLPPPPGAYSLDLGSGSGYVTFGDPDKLDLAQFTIETWFKRTGAGTPNTTGEGGIPSAIPLVTHGAAAGRRLER